MVEPQVEQKNSFEERSLLEDNLDHENDQVLSVANSPIILFDESHNELLLTQTDETSNTDTCEILCRKLVQLGYHVPVPGDRHESITSKSLEGFEVLVLAAPQKSLTVAEIDAIIDFVKEQGKSLLIANNYQSLWNQTSDSTNVLLESFGLRAEQLLSRPPREVSRFHLHYLSSEVHKLCIKDPTYLKTLNDLPYVVANLPETNKPFLAVAEFNPGRVVAIGDFLIFADKYIEINDNQQLALNIFRWLTHNNSLDCYKADISQEVLYGHETSFSVVLSNPNQKRLEHIQCLLESDKGVLIQEPLLTIRSIPPGGQTLLQWTVEPRLLGHQNLRLTIDFQNQTNTPSLFFDSVAQFQCIPDAEIDLVFLNQQGQVQELVETGNPFEVKGVVRWADNARQVPIQLTLKCPLSHIVVEPIELNHWRLTALDAGNWQVTLEINEINQHRTRLVHAYPSTQTTITTIEREIVAPLEAQIHHQMSEFFEDFDMEVIRQIPFRLRTPEEHVRELYAHETQEFLIEALQTARESKQRFFPLVDDLLRYIAPTYSPIHGCSIPYAPELAAYLAKIYPTRLEKLAYNFLCIKDDKHYGQIWLEGNIAALLLHEKYGHGFFYTQTTLGKQLAILYRHNLLGSVDQGKLKSPYLRSLLKDYQLVIAALRDSAIILNEGFATWIELTGLQRLSVALSQTVHRRKDFLFNYDKQLKRLARESQYFQRPESMPPFYDSIYQEGCEYLESIQSYIESSCSHKCVVQAMVKAADVDLGITEEGGTVRFGLSANEMREALLEAPEDDARADMRLRRIEYVLRESHEQLQKDQQKLQCDRSSLHTECPVNRIVARRLGW